MRMMILIVIEIAGFIVLAAVIHQLAKGTVQTPPGPGGGDVAGRPQAEVAEHVRAIERYVASPGPDRVRISLWHPEHGHLATVVVVDTAALEVVVAALDDFFNRQEEGAAGAGPPPAHV